MAETIHVTEYETVIGLNVGGQVILVPQEPALTTQVISFTTSTECDDAFNVKTRFVRLWSTAKTHIKFGASPTATANDTPLTGTQGEFFGVQPGHKVAAYDGSS